MSEDTSTKAPAVEEPAENKPEKFTVTVFNTMSQKEEEVEVSEKVYNEFRRGIWRIEKNEKKHTDHTIPFSALIIEDGSSENNIAEFVDMTYSPEAVFDRRELLRTVCALAPKDRNLIIALFYYHMSSRRYAEKINRSQTWIQKRKWKILEKLKNFFV